MKKFVVPVILAVVLLSVHSRGEAVEVFSATLTGSQETPPNASTATGFGTVTLDDAIPQITVDLTFSGLTGGNASAAHIHGFAPPGVAAGVLYGFTGFPAATSGTYNMTFTLVDKPGKSVAQQIEALRGGLTYLNIHNATFPGGEIRGQVTPEPTTITLLLVGAAGLAATVWKRRRTR